MSDAQIERRAEDRAEMKTDIRWIKDAVKDIATDVKNLDCKKNTEIIQELKIDYDERKQIKAHILKTIITKSAQAGGFLMAGATAVYAWFKQVI